MQKPIKSHKVIRRSLLYDKMMFIVFIVLISQKKLLLFFFVKSDDVVNKKNEYQITFGQLEHVFKRKMIL